MRTSEPSALPRSLFSLSVVAMLAFAIAQTSEGLREATAGTSAGSLAVFLEFVVDHDTAFFAEDAEYHIMADPEPLRGREAIAEFFGTMYGGAFTDTHVQVRTILADGSRVVLEFVYNGTNTGELMGQPPTGQRVSVPILGIFEIKGESIRSGRIYYDTATMTQQLTATSQRLTTVTKELLDRARSECQEARRDLAWHGPTRC
jgi:steroid delta-isomerase-like uncharacterized protein